MSRLILQNAQSIFASTVTFAGDTQSNAKVLFALNFVTEELLKRSKWKGTRTTMFVNVTQNYAGQFVITTPEGVESVDKVIMIDPNAPFNTSSVGVNIQPMWYQFSDNGLGLFPTNYAGDTQALRMGDGFCVFQDPPAGGSTFTITKEAGSETGQMIIKALDRNGNPIWNGGAEGILVNLATQLPFTSADIVTNIYEVSKPQTNGRIFLKWTSPTSTLAGLYSPNETTPNYQRYQLVGQYPETRMCLALIKRGYVMLLNAYDEVIPSNLNALRRGLQAYNYEQQNDLERAEVYWRKALEALEFDLADFQNDGTRYQIEVDMKAFALGGRNFGIQNLI